MNNLDNKIKIPKHVGLILDGNRRWAKERGVSNIKGHYKGKEVASKAGEWFFERGVEVLSMYVFSIENWNRSQEEVDYLMGLLRKMLDEKISKASRDKYKVLISGRMERLPDDIIEKCHELMDKTKDKKEGLVNFCLNYGGHSEIVDAIKKIISEGIKKDDIDEALLEKYLYNPGLPPLDIIIRTSGEKRTSGFQLWRSAYSEFLFLDKYWPDFSKDDADYIISEYNKRKRRFGGD
ncbi:di-trans,poly-cis-decaprenylcistransferase [bacterium]|nr:di-trans,poly-cis-decaprenylcistransferase [bacterium]